MLSFFIDERETLIFSSFIDERETLTLRFVWAGDLDLVYFDEWETLALSCFIDERETLALRLLICGIPWLLGLLRYWWAGDHNVFFLRSGGPRFLTPVMDIWRDNSCLLIFTCFIDERETLMLSFFIDERETLILSFSSSGSAWYCVFMSGIHWLSAKVLMSGRP